MRILDLVRRTAIPATLFVLVLAGCAKKDVDAGSAPTSGEAVKPVRVLVRQKNTGMLAVDGILFQVHLMTTEKATELKERLRLQPSDTLNIQEESGIEYRSPAGDKETPTPVTWKADPKDFDFLVTWTVDSVEQRKSSFNADLVIDVKEEWKAEKVGSDAVAKTWTCNYTLRAPSRFEKGLLEKTAYEQAEKHIIPARGPIVASLKSFVEENR